MSSTREDQLLHKLKHCLGPQKNQGQNWQDLKTIKNTYCASQQNPQNNQANRYKNIQFQSCKASNQTQRGVRRQPLAPSRNNPTIPAHSLRHYEQINLGYQQDIGATNRSPQRDKPIKRYQYGLGLGLGLKNNKKLPQQHAPIHPSMNQTKKTSTNYRQQVKQREYFLENQQQPPIKNIKPKYQYPFTAQSVHREKIIPQQKSMKRQHVSIKRQEVNVKSKESKQSFALSKLNRIAELNEKINDRIKNIISVFQDRK